MQISTWAQDVSNITVYELNFHWRLQVSTSHLWMLNIGSKIGFQTTGDVTNHARLLKPEIQSAQRKFTASANSLVVSDSAHASFHTVKLKYSSAGARRNF